MILAGVSALTSWAVRDRRGPPLREGWGREAGRVLRLGLGPGLGFGALLSIAAIALEIRPLVPELGTRLPLPLVACAWTLLVALLAAAGRRAAHPREVAQDGVAEDGVAEDGVAAVGVAAEGVAAEGVAAEGVEPEAQSTEPRWAPLLVRGPPLVCLLAAGLVGSRPGSSLLVTWAGSYAVLCSFVRQRSGPPLREGWRLEAGRVLLLGLGPGLGCGALLSLTLLSLNAPVFAFELGLLLPVPFAAYTWSVALGLLAAASWRATRPVEDSGGWVEAELEGGVEPDEAPLEPLAEDAQGGRGVDEGHQGLGVGLDP